MPRSLSQMWLSAYQNGAGSLLLFFIAALGSYPLKMILHYNWGHRAVSRNFIHSLAVLAALGLFGLTIADAVPVSPVMLMIMAAFLGFNVFHRIKTSESIREGRIILSLIAGFHSWLYPPFRDGRRKLRSRLPHPIRRFVPFRSEQDFQSWIEPIGIVAIGLLVLTVDQLGGMYLMAAGVSLSLMSRTGQMLAEEVLWNHLDGLNEAQAIAEATQYMLSSKDDGEDDDEPEAMRGNVFGRAMSASLRNPKVAEKLRQAREQAGPSPWEVGVSGQPTNGVAMAAPQSGADSPGEEAGP